MIDTNARIQINRDSLKKIVRLTAESKIDKIRIKELEKLITDMMEWFIKYGHTPECGIYYKSETCTCEYENIMKKCKDIKDR